MFWQSIDYLKAHLTPPEGFELDHLHWDEVDGLIANLERWFPEARASGERLHLTKGFYELKCQLKGQTEDRRIFPMVVKHRGKIVAMTTMEKDRDDLTVTIRYGAVAPECRGQGLGKLSQLGAEVMARGAGGELLYFFTTLRTPLEQIISEKYGYVLVGILPSSDREIFEDGTIHRVSEAIYAKSLTEADLFSTEGLCLTPRTQALWDFLRRAPAAQPQPSAKALPTPKLPRPRQEEAPA